MHKRFVTTLLICALCALCAVCFAACNKDETTDGNTGNGTTSESKTYQYYDITMEFADTADDNTKNYWNDYLPKLKQAAEKDNDFITLNPDGTFEATDEGHPWSGTYTIDGTKIIFIDDEDGWTSELVLSGDCILAIHDEYPDVTYTFIAKLKNL